MAGTSKRRVSTGTSKYDIVNKKEYLTIVLFFTMKRATAPAILTAREIQNVENRFDK